MRHPALLLSGLVLAAGLAIMLLHSPSRHPGKGRHLAAVMPRTVAGWTSRDLQLGPTEEVRGAVAQTLRYEDVLYREYRSALGSVGVYVAYWGPGQMPTQLVAAHTPDRCWVEVGWVCEERRHQAQLLPPESDSLPGEWRLFAAPGGQRLQVLYWHLVDGRVHDQGDRLNRAPSPGQWLREAVVQVFRAPPEQYFIRLSSERPLAELQGDPGWRQLVEALGGLGLREPGKP